MDIQELRYFVTVAQTLNITRAAEQLFISRQALSKSIHGLEKECGCELFLRTSGKLQLTQMGHNLLEKSIPLMDLFSDIEKSIPPNPLKKKSILRIAIGLGTMYTLPTGVFVHFKHDHPDIELIIREVCDDEVRRNLDGEEVDLGILNSMPDKISNYDFHLVQAHRVWFQMSRNNPLSKKDHLDLTDLDRQPFVTLGERVDVHSMLMEKCRQVNAYPNIVLETIDSNVANTMVFNDMAISFAIPTHDSMSNPLIQILPIDLGDTAWGIYVISRKGFGRTPAMDMLMDYLIHSSNPQVES
jgi:LysR family transcriptional regulator, transcription activator of glutamate synthase operon